MRRPILHLAEAALAYWAMRTVLEYRPVGSSVAALLPTIGMAVVLASLVLVAVDVLAVLPKDGTFFEVVGRIGRWSRWVVVGFVWIAIALMLNARLDRSAATAHRAEVVRVGARTQTPGAALVHSWMDVRSATLAADVMRVPLGPREQGVFWRQEPVLVLVRQGRFGVPWIARLERDLEGHYRNVLARLPGARGPSQALVSYFVDHMRWEDARDEATRYLAVHPEDVEFAVYAGASMSVRGWLDTSAAMLRLAADRRPDRYLLARLAWVGTRLGHHARAVEVARAGAERYRDAWEFPLVVGYALDRMGERRGAVAALDEAATLHPGVPEVTQALATLRTQTR